jgi:hypothetical protein
MYHLKFTEEGICKKKVYRFHIKPTECPQTTIHTKGNVDDTTCSVLTLQILMRGIANVESKRY